MSMLAGEPVIDEYSRIVRAGELEQLRSLLERTDLNVDATDNNGSTALMIASVDGNLEIVRYLLDETKAALDITNSFGNTALHFASQNGHKNIIEALLGKGANINIQNNDGYTPLSSACAKGESEAAEELLAAGADVELVTSEGSTPLMLSAREGSMRTVQLLLENHADTNRRNKRGETALILAAQGNHTDIVAILLNPAFNTDVLARNTDGMIALTTALAAGHLDVANLLRSASCEDTVSGGPLHSAPAAQPAHSASDATITTSAFFKYYKMMMAGIPKLALAEKMVADGMIYSESLGMELLALDPNQRIPDKFFEIPNYDLDRLIPASQHPQYQRFFKALELGLPKNAVKELVILSGLDAGVLDKGEDELVPQQCSDVKPAMKAAQDHRYALLEMLRAGLPKEAVMAKVERTGLPNIAIRSPFDQLTPDGMTAKPAVEPGAMESGAAAEPADAEEKLVPVFEHPKYVKFFKMLKVGLPPPAVQNKMTQEGVDPAVLDKDPSELIPLNDKPKEEEGAAVEMVPIGAHPMYFKYFKMLKIGLPAAAVKLKMQQEGVDPDMLDKPADENVPLNDKPKFFKVLKVGLLIPRNDKPKVTKKKLFWHALGREKLKNSMWADDGGEDEGDLHVDEEEFKRLFVQPDNVEEKKAAEAAKKATKVFKMKQTLIDMKRAINAGILLARIRYTYHELREKIMDMDGEGITTDQLRYLEEFLPTTEEEWQLTSYTGDVKDLGQAEQYMKVMSGFNSAPRRIRCMIFKEVFQSRVNECKAHLSTIENACDDVKLSGRLKKVLKTILYVGNQLNDGNNKGFTVGSLLKLQSAKAFDRKTSVLQYVITLIHRNDPDCLRFPEDLAHVSKASQYMLSDISNEMNALRDELDINFKIVTDIEKREPTHKTGLMVDFFVQAEATCRELEGGFESTKKKFVDVLTYFGENTSMSLADFFGTMHEFVQAFVSVRDNLESQRQAEINKNAYKLTPVCDVPMEYKGTDHAPSLDIGGGVDTVTSGAVPQTGNAKLVDFVRKQDLVNGTAVVLPPLNPATTLFPPAAGIIAPRAENDALQSEATHNHEHKAPTFFFNGTEIVAICGAFENKVGGTFPTNPTLRTIFRGRFSVTSKISAETTQYPVILKCAMKECGCVPSESLVCAIQQEYSMYKIIQESKNFNQSDGATGCVWCWDVHPQHHYLLLEDFGMDLRQALTEKNKLYQHELMEKTITALNALHNRYIIHGDIKPENILYHIEQRGGCEVKLCDLECARPMGSSCKAAMLGTRGYVPPQTFLAARRGENIMATPDMDMFALGLVFWQVLAWQEQSPLVGCTAEELETKFNSGSALLDCLQVPNRVLHYRPLLGGLLELDPTQRLTAEEAGNQIHSLRFTPSNVHAHPVLRAQTRVAPLPGSGDASV